VLKLKVIIMAYEMDTLDITLLAATDLSAYQYCFVKLTADNTVNVCGAGEQAIGILQNKPNALGKEARVRVFGVSRIKNGVAGAIGYGVKVMSGALGVGVASTTDKDIFFGIVLDGVSAQNEIATMLLTGINTLSA
jgi:hypothetical protein